MAGKIPGEFIDELVARVDIVDVIDRRVPLTRKGKEFQACCPFHEEKTASFTVSPVKQFYHCFGCGAHGTAIGFLMEYANLSFVEAIEELADGVGLQVPRQNQPHQADTPGENTGDLLRAVEQANFWFQQQLRKHPDAKQAVTYLKSRGLDGNIAASFGIGFAPDSWDDLASALGTSTLAKQQLVKAGLITKKDRDNPDSGDNVKIEEVSEARYYDRFRSRIIFPIEDHRGRVVGFGGRILGDGEPKYLNSPETALYHKGAELYGLHRARRAIGNINKSVVVEGYMDVVSLAQFGVDNTVATLGTATTRTHLQRLFRLAPEVVFCFDGDRAGLAAAWKALQVSLPEMQDGRQIGFLFLPEGEDPDTIVRSEGRDAFMRRVDEATPLPEFLFENLISQVDMGRLDGKARLVSLAKPLIDQLPSGALKEMTFARLSSLSGLTNTQLGKQEHPIKPNLNRRYRKHNPSEPGQISPLAFATSLLLQNPQLAVSFENVEKVQKLRLQGSDVLLKMIEIIRDQPDKTTAQLLELFRESTVHGYLEKLAMRPNEIHEDALQAQFNDTIERLLESQKAEERQEALENLRQKNINELNDEEKKQLVALLKARNEGFSEV
jgi:DNA primase